MHRRVNSEVRSSIVDSLLSTKVSLGNSVSSFSFALQRRRGGEFTGSLELGAQVAARLPRQLPDWHGE